MTAAPNLPTIVVVLLLAMVAVVVVNAVIAWSEAKQRQEARVTQEEHLRSEASIQDATVMTLLAMRQEAMRVQAAIARSNAFELEDADPYDAYVLDGSSYGEVDQ